MTATEQVFPYTLRSETEIADKLNHGRGLDPFGFKRSVLVFFLPFDAARPHLKDDVTEEQWNDDRTPLHIEKVFAEAVDYLRFAWGKASDHRGLSAARSIDKMEMYCWILGAEPGLIEGRDYANYGTPGLKAAAEFLRQPIPEDRNLVRMMQGIECTEGCQEGCRS